MTTSEKVIKNKLGLLEPDGVDWAYSFDGIG